MASRQIIWNMMRQPRIFIEKVKSLQNVEIFHVISSLINCMCNYKRIRKFCLEKAVIHHIKCRYSRDNSEWKTAYFYVHAHYTQSSWRVGYSRLPPDSVWTGVLQSCWWSTSLESVACSSVCLLLQLQNCSGSGWLYHSIWKKWQSAQHLIIK